MEVEQELAAMEVVPVVASEVLGLEALEVLEPEVSEEEQEEQEVSEVDMVAEAEKVDTRDYLKI